MSKWKILRMADNQDLQPAAALVMEDDYWPYANNNSGLRIAGFTSNCQLVLDILEGHSLNFALTENPQVPEVYLQQLWATITSQKIRGKREFHFARRR